MTYLYEHCWICNHCTILGMDDVAKPILINGLTYCPPCAEKVRMIEHHKPLQSTMGMFNGFPFACTHSTDDMSLMDWGEWMVWCNYHDHRIAESECLGMECPACEIRGLEELS